MLDDSSIDVNTVTDVHVSETEDGPHEITEKTTGSNDGKN